MNASTITIEVLWLFLWMMLCLEYFDILSAVGKVSRLVAMFIFLIGAPFFLIVNVLEAIISMIFPKGWDGMMMIQEEVSKDRPFGSIRWNLKEKC